MDLSGTLTLVCHWKFREKEWTHVTLQESFIGVRVLKRKLVFRSKEEFP